MQGIMKAGRKKWSIAIALGIGSACASGGELGRKRFSITDTSGTSERSSTEVPASKLVLQGLRIHLLELVFGPDWITIRIQLTNDGNEAIQCQPNAILFAYNELEYSPQVLLSSEDSDHQNESMPKKLPSSKNLPPASWSMLHVPANQQLQLNLRYNVGKEVSHRSELVFRGLFVHEQWLYAPRIKIPARGAVQDS